MYQQQQQLIQQPWQRQFNNPNSSSSNPSLDFFHKLNLVLVNPKLTKVLVNKAFAGYGQPHIQPSYQHPPYTGFFHQPYQDYQMQMPYVGMKIPIAQVIPSYPRYAQPDLN